MINDMSDSIPCSPELLSAANATPVSHLAMLLHLLLLLPCATIARTVSSNTFCLKLYPPHLSFATVQQSIWTGQLCVTSASDSTFVWMQLWPKIAAHFGMETGPNLHISLDTMMNTPDKKDIWAKTVKVSC